jgi:hypothetical protein
VAELPRRSNSQAQTKTQDSRLKLRLKLKTQDSELRTAEISLLSRLRVGESERQELTRIVAAAIDTIM